MGFRTCELGNGLQQVLVVRLASCDFQSPQALQLSHAFQCCRISKVAGVEGKCPGDVHYVSMQILKGHIGRTRDDSTLLLTDLVAPAWQEFI